MKQQLHTKLQKQALKGEKIRQMEISGAEAVIQSLTEQGFNVKGEFLENRVSLAFTLNSGKVITLQVDYTSLPPAMRTLQNLSCSWTNEHSDFI